MQDESESDTSSDESSEDSDMDVMEEACERGRVPWAMGELVEMDGEVG